MEQATANPLNAAQLTKSERRVVERFASRLDKELGGVIAEGESPFNYSVHVHDPEWLRKRREIDSFFIQEVDRDKIVLAGSALD